MNAFIPDSYEGTEVYFILQIFKEAVHNEISKLKIQPLLSESSVVSQTD